MKILITFLLVGFVQLGIAQEKPNKIENLNNKLDSLKQKMARLNADDDGDGILNMKDQCRNTPKNAKIDGNGCSYDVDLDGILDFYDSCIVHPITLEMRGCQQLTEFIMGRQNSLEVVQFDVLHTKVNEYNNADLNTILRLISKIGQGQKFEITVNSQEFDTVNENVPLSMERAQNILEYINSEFPELQSQFMISNSVLTLQKDPMRIKNTGWLRIVQ